MNRGILATHSAAHIARSFTLPSGLKLENRLAKAATSECLGELDHRPSRALAGLYERFAQGGAGLLITGNVMVHASAVSAASR